MAKSYNERMEILKQESAKTMDDLYEKVNKYGRCYTVRPTGLKK